jgi:periplasmic protein CpxP/Spy
MKTFKFGLLVVSFLAASLTFGQEKTKLTPEQRADRKTEHMAKQLSLTPEQTNKVSVLNRGIAQKNESIRSNPRMTAEQKQAALKANKEHHETSLKSILTAEQFEKYQQNQSAKQMKQSEIEKKQPAPKKELPKKAEEENIELEEL